MADKLSLARPYAKAVFELATANKAYLRWSYVLGVLTALVKDPQIKPLLSNQIEAQALGDFLCEIVVNDFTEEESNLIRVLAAKRRLNIIEQVALLYEQLRAAAEKTLEVELISAVPLNETQKATFGKELGDYFSRTVELKCKVDKNLMGGYLAKAGNHLIDGSLRGELRKLQQSMGG